MELDHLMDIFHQAVTFLFVIVCPLRFLRHTVLITICNFDPHKQLTIFQRSLDTHGAVSQLEMGVYLEMTSAGSSASTSLVFLCMS